MVRAAPNGDSGEEPRSVRRLPAALGGPVCAGLFGGGQTLGSTAKLRGKPMQGLATSTMVRSEVSPMFHE